MSAPKRTFDSIASRIGLCGSRTLAERADIFQANAKDAIPAQDIKRPCSVQAGLESVEMIRGPISMSVYAIKGKRPSPENPVEVPPRFFWLFGDSHTPYSPKTMCSHGQMRCFDYDQRCRCVDLQEWLQMLFCASPECVDFFLEQEFVPAHAGMNRRTRDLKGTDVLLLRMRDHFSQCLQPNKQHCADFGNVRMHYCDTRMHDFLHTFFHSLEHVPHVSRAVLYPLAEWECVFDVMWASYGFTSGFFHPTVQVSRAEMGGNSCLPAAVHNLLQPRGNSEWLTQADIFFWMSVLGDYLMGPMGIPRGDRPARYQRQLQDITNPVMRDFFVSTMREATLERAQKLATDVPAYLEDAQSSTNKWKDGLLGLSVAFTALSMDFYTLARMLRSFTSNVVVVFAGDAHIRMYRSFFNQLVEKKIAVQFIEYDSPLQSFNTKEYDRDKCIPLRRITGYGVDNDDSMQASYLRALSTMSKMERRPCALRDPTADGDEESTSSGSWANKRR